MGIYVNRNFRKKSRKKTIGGVPPDNETLLNTFVQIKTEIHYPIPPHKQTAMEGIISKNWPIAELIHKTSLSLPISYGTNKYEVERICEVINDFK